MTQKKLPKKKRACFWLSSDKLAWLQAKARKEGRSASNYLEHNLINRAMKGRA